MAGVGRRGGRGGARVASKEQIPQSSASQILQRGHFCFPSARALSSIRLRADPNAPPRRASVRKKDRGLRRRPPSRDGLPLSPAARVAARECSPACRRPGSRPLTAARRSTTTTTTRRSTATTRTCSTTTRGGRQYQFYARRRSAGSTYKGGSAPSAREPRASRPRGRPRGRAAPALAPATPRRLRYRSGQGAFTAFSCLAVAARGRRRPLRGTRPDRKHREGPGRSSPRATCRRSSENSVRRAMRPRSLLFPRGAPRKACRRLRRCSQTTSRVSLC